MLRIQNPTSDFTGGQFRYLQQQTDKLRTLPAVSYFTQSSPNGNVLGQIGDLAIQAGSGTTASRLWMNMSDASNSVTSGGWTQLSTLTVVNTSNTNQALMNPGAPFGGAVSVTSVQRVAVVNFTGGYTPPALVELDLPTANSFGTGYFFSVRQISSVVYSGCSIVIKANGAETIDAGSKFTTDSSGSNAAYQIVSIGTGWVISGTQVGI